jgi:DNA repair exonuclease SbcCD ATPase subunit
MSLPIPQLNPSQAVERIREVIVGRQLDRIEQRLTHLETTAQPAAIYQPLEDRLVSTEAKLEALQDNIGRYASSTREVTEQRFATQQQETQRLAAQIQQVAAMKSSASPETAVAQLEGKIGAWLGDWQASFHGQLNDRDQQLVQQLRGEVAHLWENNESQITHLQSRMLDSSAIEERFNRIAIAARALAECASPTPPNPGHATR